MWEFDQWNRPLRAPHERDPRFLVPFPPEFAMRMEVSASVCARLYEGERGCVYACFCVLCLDFERGFVLRRVVLVFVVVVVVV